MDRAQAALVRRQKQTRGRTVTYARGAEATTVTAWPGATLYARATEDPGASVVRGDADYLFVLAELLLNGEPIVPQEGDRLTDPTVLDPETGAAVVFELLTPTGEPAFRFSDQGRTTARVHCKRVPPT
jgi:hypothetical protein